MTQGWTIVLDVGKTLSKATLWDENGGLIARLSRSNNMREADGYRALDTLGIEQWLEQVLREFAGRGPVRAIVPVAHGAGAAVIRNNRLVCAPMDYEWPGPVSDRPAYDKQRDPFAITGSPALPASLNLGVQFHRLEAIRPDSLRSSQIVPWAQYWAWLLSGVAASEVTSLGCHTDLWRPYEHAPSQLAVRRGWAECLAPLSPADAVLGTLTTNWVSRTGLSANVEILCGLHDSNAALLAVRGHRQTRDRDATVLSTGTWFVAMRAPLQTDSLNASDLPERRDCLVNVDVSGTCVPSSRFMGGREIEILIGRGARDVELTQSTDEQIAAAIRTIDAGDMILPAAVPGVGPFPRASLQRVGQNASAGDIRAAAHLYAALVADVSLDLIGSRDCLILEGRFSRAPVFARALASLRPDMSVLVSRSENGVAHGAMRLRDPTVGDESEFERVLSLPVDIAGYRARWRNTVDRREYAN